MPGQIGGPLARLSYLATSVPGKDDPISEECPSVLDLTRVEVIHQLVIRHVYILDGCIHQSVCLIGWSYRAASICIYLLSILTPYTLQSLSVSLVRTKAKQLLYHTREELYNIYVP